ncbi:MAG: VCBS repeat-containing protein [Nitrospirae bacterium]|nr:VCBS repeat-containing protein [Nitrospirota bacterium]
MKKFHAVLLAAILVLVSSNASAADKQEYLTVEGMADRVIAHFPRAEGLVTFADEKTVRLDIGSADGLKPGMTVLLSRPGKPIRHPVTKVVLGSREEDLGSAVVTEAGEAGSTARISELKATRIVDGDICRLPTGPDKVAVGVLGNEYNEVVLDRLLNALRDSRRFAISGPVNIPGETAVDASSVAKLAGENKVDSVIVLTTAPTTKQEETNVSITLYAKSGDTVEAQAGLVNIASEVFGETIQDIPLVRGERRDFYRTEDIPMRGTRMAAGRITGSDKTEIAVAAGRRLVVYRFEKGVLSELWRYEGDMKDDYLDLECADLNGNGRDELYVSNFRDGLFMSFVMEYDGKDYKMISEDLAIFMRVLELPGGKKMLIASGMGMDAPYSGVVREYRWEGGKLAGGDTLDLPSRIKDPYGFVALDLVKDADADAERDDDDPLKGLEYVWVDDWDYIQVLDSNGRRLWKSPDPYGGYGSFFELPEQKLNVGGGEERGKVKGRLILRDGPDGGKEIVITKNIPMINILRRFKGYNGAEIYSFAWDGSRLEHRWDIKNIDGFLADIYVGDAANNKSESVLILTEPTIKVKKASNKIPLGSVESIKNLVADRSSLVIYRVPQR